MNEPTAKEFISQLSLLKSAAELKNVERFFRDKKPDSKFLGIRMSAIFDLAKAFMEMSLAEIEVLLQSEYYEVRMGAVSIMDFQARDKKTTATRKKELFDLYIRRHDRIDNWDLVDRSAPYVVGGYLFDKPREILYRLAKSGNVWERRTAIVSTYFFIRQNDLSDTFKIAELLVHDPHDLIQKAVGSWIREAGKKDKLVLIEFLDTYAGSMPREMLRYAVEKLDEKGKQYYLGINGRNKESR
ncbi:MAG TPA: DNA alkylation repair protein [Pedobacter sp.]|uniref:DNA alkylation repair protein n=1 Tax=Pedobacter sp. TaxID=1411316 RepID=UPI002CE18BD5|nr:DNA alkylation repair protein [Pedobacter sp.]HMI04500.1 DNA alkylation repair protein [Pedobacter sp.]